MLIDPRQRVILGNGRTIVTGSAPAPAATAAPVAEPTAQPTVQPVQPAPAPPGHASSNNAPLLLAALVAAILGIGAVMFWRASWRRPPGT